ncbi:MAG: DUF6290 family protein [Eubacteriales bacterium]
MEQVTITMDKRLKLQTESYLSKLGLSWTEFFHQSLLNQIPNAETISVIEAIEHGEDEGKNYHSMGEFWKELEEDNADS